jgi:hypothetical protein
MPIVSITSTKTIISKIGKTIKAGQKRSMKQL